MKIICTIRATHEHPDLTHTRWIMGTAELKLTHHTGSAPDVGRCAVVGADQDLHRAVLARLDVLSEVLVLRTGQKQVPFTPSGQKQTTAHMFTHHPAGITQVSNLDGDFIGILGLEEIQGSTGVTHP